MAEWRNEASRVQDWNGAYTLTYPQYLTLQGYERSMRTAFDDQAEEINSANREALIELGAALEETLADGFEAIDRRLVSVSRGVEEVRDELSAGFSGVTSALYWGFNVISTGLTLIYGQLDELINLTKAPTHTWSNERFKLALDAQNRCQFLDALTYTEQAIVGFGSNPGISTDWRYHYLLGDILLGNFRNHSPEVVDAGRAERSFLKAASCARLDNALMAGRSLVRAGRAALIQGQYRVASEHTEAGLVLAPDHAQGLYQAARLACVLNDPKTATARLARAFPINSALYLSALKEPDFLSFEDVIRNATALAETRSRELYEERKLLILGAIQHAETLPIHFAAARTALLEKSQAVRGQINEIDTTAEGDFADTEHARIQLLDLEDEVLSLSGSALELFRHAAEKASTTATLAAKGKRQQMADLAAEIQKLRNRGPGEDKRAGGLPAMVTIIALLCYICFIILIDFPKFGRGFSDDGEAIGTILSWPILLLIIWWVGSSASQRASDRSRELREREIGELRTSIASLETAAREAEQEAFGWERERDGAVPKFSGSIAAGQIAKAGVIRDQS